jgi:glutamate racemase
LLQQGCKVILIACNSASAAAYDLVKAYVGSKALVLNVIDPVVDYVSNSFSDRKIGLIGTKQTVGSEVYLKKLKTANSSITLNSLATPLLVPMIEEGFYKNDISDQIIGQYLKDPSLNEIEALILGCTHYPLIRKQVAAFFDQHVQVIDSSLIVAESLRQMLSEKDLLASECEGEDRFLVSDFTPSFQTAAELFFQRKIILEKHILWE